jgi:hypothetical protein
MEPISLIEQTMRSISMLPLLVRTGSEPRTSRELNRSEWKETKLGWCGQWCKSPCPEDTGWSLAVLSTLLLHQVMISTLKHPQPPSTLALNSTCLQTACCPLASQTTIQSWDADELRPYTNTKNTVRSRFMRGCVPGRLAQFKFSHGNNKLAIFAQFFWKSHYFKLCA